MFQRTSKRAFIQWAAICGSSLFLAVWTYSHIAQSIYVSQYFDGFIANGPFQLFNPLRRIANGQIAGVDFQFFHGIGVPFLHYPLFALFGKSLFASELSRNLTSLICFLSSLIVFGFVITEHSIKRTLFFTVSAICLLEFLSLERVDSYGLALATPGNSLLGVRAIFPIFTFSVLLSRLPTTFKSLATGILFAASLFFGTEHGIALIVSFIIINGIALAASLVKKTRMKELGKFSPSLKFHLGAFSTFLASIVLIFGSATRFSGIGQVLKYNLLEVPADQFWYFGAPPNDYAYSLLDFDQLTWRGIFLLTVVVVWLIACVYRFFISEPTYLTIEHIILTHMLCYGLMSCASCLGMLEVGYLLPMVRIFVLAILIQLFKERLLQKLINKVRESRSVYMKPVLPVLTILLLTFFTAIIFISVKRLPPVCYLPGETVTPQLSVAWNRHFSQIDSAIQSYFPNRKPYKLWSTYAGLLEDRLQTFHPKDDYIIHALGKNRRESYISAFQSYQADVVQTLRRSHFIHYTKNRDYEQWLRNTTWGFYESVLLNYEILEATDRSIFWIRKELPWVANDNNYTAVPFSENANSIEIPLPTSLDSYHLTVIKLQYHISNPWKAIPFIGSLPRYLVKLENTANSLPISLSPYQQEIHFPISVIPGAAPLLTFETHSLIPGAKLNVDSISYKLITLTKNQEMFLRD